MPIAIMLDTKGPEYRIGTFEMAELSWMTETVLYLQLMMLWVMRKEFLSIMTNLWRILTLET